MSSKEKKYILGIETSCDDTSLCILETDDENTEVLFHKKYSQDLILKKWGGVVPEIAARNHLAKITPLMQECFEATKLKINQIDLIGVTVTPGLLGPLLTGLNAAKSLSLLHPTPIFPVNHLNAHLEAIHLTEQVEYPYLGLLVSGGHTMILKVENKNKFTYIGGTIDDAAGEAFDKAGKIMGLGYPAGHLIDRYASWGDEKKFSFPIGMRKDPTCNMSFSGIKTAIRVFVEKHADQFTEHTPEMINPIPQFQFLYDTCASFQKAIVDTLCLKLKIAYKELDKKLPIVVGGGVACNSKLRKEISKQFKNSYFVKPEFCTDNGAMIANYARLHFSEATQYPKCLTLDAKGSFSYE